MRKAFPLSLFLIICFINVDAALWRVGPTRTFKKPVEVSNLVQDGDTIEIDEGVYVKDVVRWSKNNLVLRGMGKGAHLDAQQTAYGRKAI